MRTKFAIFTALGILVLTAAVVSISVPAVVVVVFGEDHAAPVPPLKELAFAIGYFVMLGLLGSAAAIGIATGVQGWIHRPLTVVFVVLSFLGAGISIVTWLFTAIGLFALGPISFGFRPDWRGRGTSPTSAKP